MLKRFLRWCFAVDNTEPSGNTVIQRSVNGNPLLVMTDGGMFKPWTLRSTPDGMRGSVATANIQIQFNSNIELSKEILMGLWDDYLCKASKDKILGMLKRIVYVQNGFYRSYARDHREHLTIQNFNLSEQDMLEFKELLRASYSG